MAPICSSQTNCHTQLFSKVTASLFVCLCMSVCLCLFYPFIKSHGYSLLDYLLNKTCPCCRVRTIINDEYICLYVLLACLSCPFLGCPTPWLRGGSTLTIDSCLRHFDWSKTWSMTLVSVSRCCGAVRRTELSPRINIHNMKSFVPK